MHKLSVPMSNKSTQRLMAFLLNNAQFSVTSAEIKSCRFLKKYLKSRENVPE